MTSKDNFNSRSQAIISQKNQGTTLRREMSQAQEHMIIRTLFLNMEAARTLAMDSVLVSMIRLASKCQGLAPTKTNRQFTPKSVESCHAK